MIEPDEEKKTYGGQFPKNKQTNEVFGKHQAQHGPHKQTQVAIKTIKVPMAFELSGCIGTHQSANAGDERNPFG